MGAPEARTTALRRAAALIVALALAIPLAIPAPAMASKTLGLSNASFDFNVAPGQTGAGDMFVYNDGSEPIKVMVYAADQVTDAKGKVTYVVPTRDLKGVGKSPASWIRITLPESTKAIGNTPYLEMEPGQRVPVKFDFGVPQGVAPGDHQLLIFFEMFSFPGEVQGSGSMVSGRLGARIRLRVQGEVQQSLLVRPFAIRGFVIGDKAPYSLVLRNDGNVDVPLSGTVTFLDGSDAEVLESTVVTETTVYAQTMSEHAGVLDVSRAGIGRFTAQLRIDYKKESADGRKVDDSIVVDRTVWVIPLWVAVLAVAGVGLALLGLFWRAAATAARRKAAAKAKRARATSAMGPRMQRRYGQPPQEGDAAGPSGD